MRRWGGPGQRKKRVKIDSLDWQLPGQTLLYAALCIQPWTIIQLSWILKKNWFMTGCWILTLSSVCTQAHQQPCDHAADMTCQGFRTVRKTNVSSHLSSVNAKVLCWNSSRKCLPQWRAHRVRRFRLRSKRPDISLCLCLDVMGFFQGETMGQDNNPVSI